MKKIFTLLTIITFSTAVKAQVPNAGFELLNSDGTLANWGNTYIYAIGDSIIFDGAYYYAPTSDAHTGNLAMELSNSYNFTTMDCRAGSASADTDSVYSAWGSLEFVPVTTQPTQLSFWYKFFPAGNEFAFAHVEAYDSIGNQIGSAAIALNGATSTYSYASTQMQFSTMDPVATVSINFSTVMPGGVAQFGTSFIIDDISLNTVTGIETNDKKEMVLYPNPASDRVNIANRENEKLEYTVHDSFGRIVMHQMLNSNQSSVNVESLSPGMYHVELKAGGKVQKNNLVVYR